MFKNDHVKGLCASIAHKVIMGEKQQFKGLGAPIIKVGKWFKNDSVKTSLFMRNCYLTLKYQNEIVLLKELQSVNIFIIGKKVTTVIISFIENFCFD